MGFGTDVNKLLTTEDFDETIATILTTANFDEAMAIIKNMPGSSYDAEDDSLESIGTEHHHITGLFPEDTDETITFTAGGTDNAWSSWAEIVDNNGVKLSDKLSSPAHFTAFLIEDCNVKDKTYLFEIAYGDAKTVIARYRFIAGETTKLPAVQQVRIRSEHIPADEKVYYRMKCEDGGKTCQLHIRYYLHD